MYNYIVRFLKFLLPIFGTAAVKVAADTLSDVAYPNARPRRRYSSATGIYGRPRVEPYNRFDSRSFERDARFAREHQERIDARIEGLVDDEPLSIREQNAANDGFHDVLMVAFDISGPNKQATHEWLIDNMPKARGYEADSIDLDAWWIADDDAFGDCDSAVFVSKGNQAEARRLLRQHGLVL